VKPLADEETAVMAEDVDSDDFEEIEQRKMFE
jgi:hypothetical protein